jgi:hypothetical protein
MNLRIAAELAPQFLNKSWLLNQSPLGSSFFISDNPVIRYNDQPSLHVGNNGLACPSIQIHMPECHELSAQQAALSGLVDAGTLVLSTRRGATEGLVLR